MGDVSDLTGYQGGSDASGKGGRARERKIMDAVDQAQRGPSSSSGPPPAPQKVHPAAYKPSPQESASRSYGAPVDKPILSGGGS